MHVVELELGCLERSGRGRAEFLNERIDNAPTPLMQRSLACSGQHAICTTLPENRGHAR